MPPSHDEARAIFTAQDRIPTPHFRAGGIDNFWQDATNIHGVWRHTGKASYRTATPQWETLLDLDALSKAEGKNWIWKGADCLRPTQTICMVSLSNGGGDAVETREFDTVAKRFADGGFRFAEGKQDGEWIDKDSQIISREWTKGEVTDSGYGYVVKVATRSGDPREVFRGLKTDVSVTPAVLRGEGGRPDALMVRRGVTFFQSEFSLLTDKGPVRIALPLKADYRTYVDGRLIFALKEPWKSFKAGALVAYDLKDLKADAAAARPDLIFQPGPRQRSRACRPPIPSWWSCCWRT